MPLAFCPLRLNLRDNRAVTGVFCELPCPESVEIIIQDMKGEDWAPGSKPWSD